MVPESWLAEWNELTGPVEELFAEVKARRLRAPSRDACASVASALLVMRHKAAVAPLRKDATRGARNGARKSGRALLRHLQPLRRKLAAEIAELSTTASKFGARERERLEAAARAAQAADDRLEAAARAARRAADRAFAGWWRPDKIYRARGSARVGGRQRWRSAAEQKSR
jgi:hypothetical protein